MIRENFIFRWRQTNIAVPDSPAVTGEHYEGGHWLGSFAVYPQRKRGISDEKAK